MHFRAGPSTLKAAQIHVAPCCVYTEQHPLPDAAALLLGSSVVEGSTRNRHQLLGCRKEQLIRTPSGYCIMHQPLPGAAAVPLPAAAGEQAAAR